MATLTQQPVLVPIAPIPSLEPGKLSPCSFKNRSPGAGHYYKLQHWLDGKNHTRHVSTEKLPQIQEAVQGYRGFRERTDEYARQLIEESRQAIRTGLNFAATPSHGLPPLDLRESPT